MCSVCVCDGHAFPPNPKPPYHPKGGLIGMYVCVYVCRMFGVVRLFWTSPNREIVFVSFVRAGEAKLRVCVREIRFLSLAGKFQNFSSPPAPAPAPASIDQSVLHGIFEIYLIFAALCMGSMPSRDFVNVRYGFCRIGNALLMFSMGCMNVV